jgi:hypothetical protein
MDENRVRLTIVPSGGDDGPLAASDFLKQVDALKKLVSLVQGGSVDAKVVKLSMNSPAVIELEAGDTEEGSKANLLSFFHDIFNVTHKAATPQNLTRDVFDLLKDFSSVVGRGIQRSIITTNYDEIVVDLMARQRIESVFGQDYTREGTIDGMLEAVNIHGKVNNCALYPIIGPSRISCRFDESLFKQVRPALGRYVLVEGILKYRWRERYPFEAMINRIEVLPNWEDQPKFADVLGIAPDATKGAPSEDFVRAARNGW